MRTTSWPALVAACVTVTVTVTFAFPARAAPLQVDLGTLGGADTIAADLNVQGQIVGCSTDAAGSWHAFLWDLAHGMTELPIAAEMSCATGINDAGQVVGYGSDASGWSSFAFLWDAGNVTVLGPGQAFDVNDVGQVLGVTYPSDGAFWGDETAWVWEAGTSRALPKPSGQFLPVGINDAGRVAASVWGADVIPMVWDLSPEGITSTTLDFGLSGQFVNALNANGQVLAEAYRSDERGINEYSAWLWDPASVVSLGTLGGKQTWIISWYHPGALNDRGEVVGISQRADGEPRAFVWSAGRMLELDGLVEPFAINNAGDVVGGRETPMSAGWNAFVWHDGTFVDLGYPKMTSFAHMVNDRGQVLAAYSLNDGTIFRSRAFAWFPSVADDVAAFGTIVDRLVYARITGELSSSTVTALEASVKAAAAQSAAGDACSAARVLGSFQNKVAALVRSGRLSAESGQRLAAEAAQAIAALGDGC